LALRAFAEVRRSIPQARLTLIGDGPDRDWLETVAKEAGIDESVEWLPAKLRKEITQQYQGSLALIFPSLHDSGGMVVLEALAAGAPVLCLDLGGPGAIVTPSCGIVVKCRQQTEVAVVESLASAMILLATDAALWTRLSRNAAIRAQQLTWDIAAHTLYSHSQQKSDE
jgi:glycosyltransferase involved in cell wall biosynthesis